MIEILVSQSRLLAGCSYEVIREQSVEQLWSKFSSIEFGAKKSLCFSVGYRTPKNQLIKFQISSTELKNEHFWNNLVLSNKQTSLILDCAMLLYTQLNIFFSVFVLTNSQNFNFFGHTSDWSISGANLSSLKRSHIQPRKILSKHFMATQVCFSCLDDQEIYHMEELAYKVFKLYCISTFGAIKSFILIEPFPSGMCHALIVCSQLFNFL